MQATVCGKIKEASLYVALDATASLMVRRVPGEYPLAEVSNTVRLAYVGVPLCWSRFEGSIYKTTYF